MYPDVYQNEEVDQVAPSENPETTDQHSVK